MISDRCTSSVFACLGCDCLSACRRGSPSGHRLCSSDAACSSDCLFHEPSPSCPVGIIFSFGPRGISTISWWGSKTFGLIDVSMPRSCCCSWLISKSILDRQVVPVQLEVLPKVQRVKSSPMAATGTWQLCRSAVSSWQRPWPFSPLTRLVQPHQVVRLVQPHQVVR